MPRFNNDIDPEEEITYCRKKELGTRLTKRRGRPKRQKLTKKAEEYIKAMIETNFDNKASKEIAGYSPNTRVTVHKSIKEEIAKIQEEVVQAMQEYAPTAVQNMINLAETAESENVKLQANKDLLDRAGYKPVDRKEIVGNFIDQNSRITHDIINRFQDIIVDGELVDE